MRGHGGSRDARRVNRYRGEQRGPNDRHVETRRVRISARFPLNVRGAIPPPGETAPQLDPGCRVLTGTQFRWPPPVQQFLLPGHVRALRPGLLDQALFTGAMGAHARGSRSGKSRHRKRKFIGPVISAP